jgi:hypothetical protein
MMRKPKRVSLSGTETRLEFIERKMPIKKAGLTRGGGKHAGRQPCSCGSDTIQICLGAELNFVFAYTAADISLPYFVAIGKKNS